MNDKIFEKYKVFQNRFGLPQLNELEETFNFDIEKEDNIFDQIRNEISERVFTISDRIVEHLVTGTESFCCLFEQNMITESERNELFHIYKKIQALKWENNMLIMKPDEKQAALWVQKAWNLWNGEVEEKLSILCKKLSVAWVNLKFENQKTYYHG